MARLHPHGGQYDLSMAVGEILPALRKESAKAGKDFGTLVRERRRKWGLRLPVQDKVLPFRSASPATTASGDMPTAVSIPQEATSSTVDTPDDAQAAWRLRLAEQRLQAVLNELQAASTHGAPPWEIRQWEQAYDDEMQTFESAYAAFHQLDTHKGR